MKIRRARGWAKDNVKLLTTASGKFGLDMIGVAAMENAFADAEVRASPRAGLAGGRHRRDRARAAGAEAVIAWTPRRSRRARWTPAADDTKAGGLIGQYAKAKVEELGIKPKIAMLDLARDVGQLRHDGFLKG